MLFCMVSGDMYYDTPYSLLPCTFLYVLHMGLHCLLAAFKLTTYSMSAIYVSVILGQ